MEGLMDELHTPGERDSFLEEKHYLLFSSKREGE
jgi:hypothetical protein